MNTLTTPLFPVTADAVLAEVAAGPVDPLDALLRQIVAGYFVLTDGHGVVSKWSEPAELLFGQPADAILGQSFFASLVAGTLPPAGQAWRECLDLGEPPRVPGTVQLTGRRSDGADFPMETVFVPVKLDEGFDFSLFLEDLSFELPMNLMLLRMRQHHPIVVRALRQAIEPEVQPWEGRTAGTLVVFRPLSSTPWVEAEMARREAARAAADAETEERLTTTDPGIQGGVADLDDAAAVVAQLLSAMERIDELERVAGGLPAQLDEARREAERRAAESERGTDALRAALSRSDERIVAMQSELTFALKSIEELKQGLSSAGQAAVTARSEAEVAQHAGEGSIERVAEVFEQILGLAGARNQPVCGPAVTPAPARAEPVERELRHGFDDAVAPMAILGLDGKFKELNPAFVKLVGYQEHEFTKAAWPSPHDRRDYKDQLEQLRQLGSGELRGVEVRSTYMHGQGLMVSVVGKLTLESGQDGAPLQLVLEAEDRHTG